MKRSALWIVASSIALLTMSRWLSATSIEYLVVATAATAAAAAAAFAVSAPIRAWAAACAISLALGVIVAANAQRELAAIVRNWPAERERLGEEALARLEREVSHSVADLHRLSRYALAAPAEREAAFEHLGSAVPHESDDAVVLRRGDSAFAWSGRPYVTVDPRARGVGVTAAGTPFYLGMFATAEDSTQRAVATRLLYAVSPADRLVQSIGGRVANEARIAGFRFRPAADSATLPGARVIRDGSQPLFAVRAELLTDGEVRLRLLERTRLRVGILLALGLAAFVVAGWRGHRSLRARGVLVAVGLACVAFTPLSAFSNYSRLFDPTLYFTPLGKSLTANAAALALTSALVLLMLLAVVRRQARLADRRVAVGIVVLVTGLGPFLLRDLARGIQIPQYGVSASLWLIWEVPLFLAAVSVILTGAAAGSAALGSSRGLPPIVAPALAVLAALIAPIVWGAQPLGWPWWYTFLWVAAIASLAVSRGSSALIVSAAAVAALGATTLVWGATTRARVRLAEQDVAALGRGDEDARALARRLGNMFSESPVSSRRGLLETYASSELAAAGYPAWLGIWRGPDAPSDTLATAALAVPLESLKPLVQRAGVERVTVEATLPGPQAVEHAIVVPTDSAVITIVVAPKSLQIPANPFSNLLGIEMPPEANPPYTLQVVSLPRAQRTTAPSWRRVQNELHGEWLGANGNGIARIHAEVDIGPLFALVQRGALIALLNLGIVGLLWLTSVVADGIAARWISVRRRRLTGSYRTRLTLALFAFFMVPAVAFAIWSYQQLSTDAARSRQLLVRETLRSVSVGTDETWLARESRRLQSPLFVYRGSELVAASDSLLESLAPIGRRLGPEIATAMLVHREVTAHRIEPVGKARTLFGYRALELSTSAPVVLAAPARADELALGRRARDLGILVLFATAIGALAALWLSGIAARQLARPIGSLRRAALAFAGGDRDPLLEGRPTVEFLPVFAAFRRMMSELNASRTALEEATRRTATVLRNVASGVIAVDEQGAVTLANPRADELLGAPLPPGTPLSSVGPRELHAIVQRFLAGSSDDETFELPHGEQQWRGQLTRLTRGGAVVTVEDVSEIARAERVLAWGEMARQVAHEIKNPLTPIRLGVQHLKRARADARVDFDRVLEKNVERILEEIDRLDEIARAFSRYGQPPEQRADAEPTDVADVLRDLVGLETMGEDRVTWSLNGADRPVKALGRKDELRQVLLNVFENARLARANRVAIDLSQTNGRVRVTVEDNGQGIPKDVLPRIFEPHFSTRTSGSGLGLAISRRVIESWGGSIELSSEENRGTTVRLELLSA